MLLFSAAFVLFQAVNAYAQLSANSFDIKTVHIFPGNIVAEGWNNVETLTFQNLDEYALFQDFNSINSATLNTSNATQFKLEKKERVKENIENSSYTDDLSTSTDEIEKEIDVEDKDLPVEPIEIETKEAEFDVSVFDFEINETEPEILDSSNSVPQTTSSVKAIFEVNQETQDFLDKEINSPEDNTEATTTVLKKVSKMYSLTVGFISSVLDSSASSTNSSDEIETDSSLVEDVENLLLSTSTESIEQIVEQDNLSTDTSVEDFADDESLTSSSSSDISSQISTDENEIELPKDNAVQETGSTSTSTSTSALTSTSTETVIIEDVELLDDSMYGTTEDSAEINECEIDCVPYTISMSDFDFPLDENVSVSGAQLRFSFAARKKTTRDHIPSFSVRYSLDNGDDWISGGSVSIVDEVSNSINGGYYLFALPEILTEKSLSDLNIELVYRDNPEILEELYVESAWLELITLEESDDITPTSIFDLLKKDGYEDEFLNGDTLELPSGKIIDFDFTDENENETLIIKTDEVRYQGLSEVTTYFSVTNTSNSSESFSVQTYFPTGVGEVTSLKVFNQNKPRKTVVPEYRPIVYHCEAGWEYIGEVEVETLKELSEQLTEDSEYDKTTETQAENIEEKVDEVKFDLSTSTPASEIEIESEESLFNTTTTVLKRLPSVTQLLNFSTTTSAVVVTEENEIETINITEVEIPASEENAVPVSKVEDSSEKDSLELDIEKEIPSYICRNTNVVRECNELDGDNTACRLNQVKVKEHDVTKYSSGWDVAESEDGSLPKPKLLRRIVEFIGFGPDKKDIPDTFEARMHTPDKYKIESGETKYFKMDISFPPFTTGEYWIEAVGDSEYGLLDPFWSSQWTYRMPITVDNLAGATSTEQQVFIEIPSTETDFWTNVKSDGGDIRFVQETPGDDSGTWYSQNWSERIPITVDSALIDAVLTDFPVYVDLSDLGSDFFGEVQNSGADIRITNDDGVTELPYELVSIDTGAETGELYFEADSLSSTVDTTFYIYFNNGAASAYDKTDTYGAENVWNNGYEGVWHMNDASPTTIEDSTGNGYTGTKGASTEPTETASPIGQAQFCDGNDYIEFGDVLNVGSNDWTISTWYEPTSVGGANTGILYNKENLYEAAAGGNFHRYAWRPAWIWRGGSSFPTSINNWYYAVSVYDHTNQIVYRNGTSVLSTAQTGDVGTNSEQLQFCARGNTSHTSFFTGNIDELRMSSVARSPEWISADYSNQATPSVFYSTSTIENFVPTTFTELDYWIQHFDNTNDEADIWVQTDTLPGGATSTIYVYYGNPDAVTTSDEYEPFTYSTSTDLYYVVNSTQVNPIVVYSLIDDNVVTLGASTTVLQSGETVSFETYSSSSVISALGPITARTSDGASEPPVPISFATTTNLVTTNRGNEEFFVHSPFEDAFVEVFEGASGVASDSSTILAGQSASYAVNLGGSDSGVLESDEPVLLYHNEPDDSYVAYPPTTRSIFGFHSTVYNYAAISGGTSVGVYCSSGASGTTTGMTRGGEESADFCSSGSAGTGDAVMLANATNPIAATQEADGDGGESSRFLPTPEFGTRYILPRDAEYVSIACAPRFGTSTIEVQNSLGAVIDSGSCDVNGEFPGALNFTPGVVYSQGYQVVSTNDVPFYMYYEENANESETNTWSAVQAKKYNSLYLQSTFGSQEQNQDAQYEQNNYRWYENLNSDTPTVPWDIDGTAVAEDSPIIDQGAVNPGDELRLRMNLLANNSTGSVDSVLFKLQYAEVETCSAATENNWFDIGDVGSTTAAFSGINNTSVGDGITLPSTLLSDSDVKGTYEEENNSATLPNEVGVGEVVEYDWALEAVNINTNSEYCFRMIRSTNQAIVTYTSYPELLTSGPPETPITTKRFNNEKATSTTPTLEFAAVDQGSDELDYQVQVSTDNTFVSTDLDRRSDVNFFDFENVNNSSDKSPFDNGALIRFTPASTLTNGLTYWWRVRAIDPAGSNSFGDWTTPQSFTIDTSGTVSKWFQTTDEQFDTNSLVGVRTSGSNSAELDIVGSTLVGEFGTLVVTNGATTSVSFVNSYADPVVVTSIRYARSVPDGDQPSSRVSNKSGTGFDVNATNFSFDAPGTSTIDWIVMEAGEWIIDDGDDGKLVFATSTSVSVVDGNSIVSNPGGPIITFPTSFSAPPAVFTTVTTVNDPEWVTSSVYDGNNKDSSPTASQASVFLNDGFADNGHGSAEDIDLIAFDPGFGTNDGVVFDVLVTLDDVTHTPNTEPFGATFVSTPAVILVGQHGNDGGTGSYAMLDTDNPATVIDVTIAAEEGGNSGGRSHTTEEMAIVAFQDTLGDILRSANAQMISTVIDFDDADVGNAWGEVDWNSVGDVAVFVQYQTGSGFQLIPDSVLPGNSSGFTSGPINILSLDTDVYNELRLSTIMSGVDPEIFDWTVSWGQRVDIPVLGDPFDNEKTADRTPVFDFITTDPQGDDLEYEISISKDPTFVGVSTTINSTASSSDFTDDATGLDTSPFNSGDRVVYTLPLSMQLDDNETYWWRVRAKDPSGADSFSPWSEPDNFTVDTSVVLSTWFQTTQAQFIEGEIDGLVASTSNSVEISDQIAEYGVAEVTNNDWLTIETELSYQDMVVVASPAFAFDDSSNGLTVQVRNKTRDSFEIKADDYTEALSGTTSVSYIVIESGDWLLADGAEGTRVLAGIAEDVSELEISSYTGVGRTINFSPGFGLEPEAILTISSNNNSQWVGTAVSSGGNQGTEIASTSMNVAMAVSVDTNTTRVAEDIDYLVFETATGSNNGVLFDALRATGIAVTNTDVNFVQTFSTAPGVILVHNNANDGAQGGFAQVDTDVPVTNLDVSLSISEIGPGANNHNAEIVSLIAFEDSEGFLARDDSVSGGLIGTIGSEPILFSDGLGPKFSQALIGATTPGNSTTSVQIQYQTATGSWALIPDSQIANNSIGNTGATIDLTSVDIVAYPVIRMFASLICDTSDCPTLDDWAVEWSEGVEMTGTLKEYDRTVNVSTATVTVSVNGAPAVKTGTVTGGVWSIPNVTAFEGDVLTVFTIDSPDANEAVAVFKYDGLGDMTGVEMFERHLSLSSDEIATTTLADLATADTSTLGGDVFFDVAGGNLTVCAVGTCADANLYVGPDNVFIPSSTTSQSIDTHDFINDGTVELDGNTVRTSGSWENNNSLSVDTSTVIFTALNTTETIYDVTGTSTFNNLTLGETSGTATWQPQGGMDINGDLEVNFGTFDRSTEPLNLAGSLLTGVNGFWSGSATTTFDGGGTSNWSDANPVSQNIGFAVIDGAVRVVTVASDVKASSIFIGTNDTLNGGGSFDIQVAGDFTNTNTFIPSTSRLIIVGDGTVSNITTNGNNLYAVRASTTNGTVAFTDATVTLLDNFEVATGTVTMPTSLLNVGGSFANTGGNFAHNNAKVRFTGTVAETVQLNGTAFLNHLHDVEFSGSGMYTFTDITATTTNDFIISNGDAVLPSGQLTVGGLYSVTGSGAFNHNNGEVVLLIKDGNTVLTNGSSLNDLRIKTDGGSGVWYDNNWNYRKAISVSASAIDTNFTDYPVYVDLADFDATFFANVKANGADIRMTTDDAMTEIPYELVSIDTIAETGELYFEAPTVSSSTNTTFYLYYGNAAASAYATTDTYGAQNVWANGYEGVWHMNDVGATIVDSTSGGYTGTKGGGSAASTEVDSPIGKAQSFDGGDYIDLGDVLDPGTSSWTIDVWYMPTAVGSAQQGILYNKENLYEGSAGGNDSQYAWEPSWVWYGAGTFTTSINNWYLHSVTFDHINQRLFKDGVQVFSRSQTGNIGSNSSRLQFGARGDTGHTSLFTGELDEIRMSSVSRSPSWLKSTHLNYATTSDFYSVSTAESSFVRTFSDTNTTVLGNLVIESGEAVFPTGILSVGGSFDNNSIFNSNGGTVEFDSIAGSETIAAGGSAFSTLKFDSTTGDFTITESATSTASIQISNANEFTLNSGLTLEALNTFNNDVGGASTTWTGSTLKLSNGTAQTINTKTNGGDDYSTLLVADGGEVKMWNSTAQTYTTNGVSSVYSQDHAGVDGSLNIFGNYVRATGTEYWSYETDFDGTDLVVSSSERQVDVRVDNNASVQISTSTLQIIGSSTASTTIAAQSGSFALGTNHATVTAQYFTMTGTDAAGLNLAASTTVTLLDNAEFTIPAVSTAITVDETTIDTNPAAQFFNTDFVSGSGNVNVTLSGSPNSFWWFREGAGDRYGEAFDNADGDPGSIRWDDSSYSINIAGTIYADDGVSTLGGPTCDGLTTNVRLVVDGGAYVDSTSCDGVTGAYSFAGVSYIGDPSILVYLDTNGGVNGSVITKTPTADILDLNIYANRVMTRHEDVSPLTIFDMASYDEDDDSDLKFVATTSPSNMLTVRPDTELIIASSTTFVPGGNITLQSSGSGVAYDGSLHIDDDATLILTGAETHSIGGSFFNDLGSVFTPASTTLTFTATTSGKGITNANLGTLNFHKLDFTGPEGSWNIGADINIADNMTISTGTVTGTGDITLQAGTLGGDGTLSMGGGTTTIMTSTTLGGSLPWTFYDLVLGDGATTSTTTRTDTATTTVSGQLVINSAHYLDAGSSVWDLAGDGTVFIENGNLLQDTSTIVYSGGVGSQVVPTTYYNLQLGGFAGTPTYSFGSMGVLVENNFTIAGNVPSTADLNSSDPVVSVLGNIFIDTNGILSLSDSSLITVSGDYHNNGTLSANGGVIEFDSTDAYSIAPGASSLADVLLSGSGAVTVIENATSTGLFTIGTSSDFTLQTGVVLAVGGELDIISPVTDWTGSTLSLYGGGDYTVNPKTGGESFENLVIDANTEIRMWGSSATSITVDPLGSLYSQDHMGVNGDLYIYGTYQESFRNDDWSYGTDFDGTDLTGGGERQVNVYFETGASALWTGGSLSVQGSPVASTTIQNQGSGTYGLTIGGNSTTEWDYVRVRDIDSDGVTFTSAPTVTDFDNVDLLVEIDSGTAMTVGGTVITASPARTLSDLIFNFDTGVTGAVNVTATGTTLSGWRFTTHDGNLDGEANDSDPAGDPGYVIWDDSAAIISISGNVYEADGSSVSSACDDSTTNIVLSIAGSIAQNASSSCASADGSYTISGVSFGSLDELVLYIDGNTAKGVTVSRDPISSISDMDIYENHVIVRHENVDPLTISSMSVWDSSDDSDIQFTALTGGTDTLSLPSDTKLLVWGNKEFAPEGNISLAGGGAGAAYDGSLEVLDGATFTAAAGETHQIGGSFEFGSGSAFVAGMSTTTFTTVDAARIIDTNGDAFYNVNFNGAGSWLVSDTDTNVLNDLTIDAGTVTLGTGTTSVGGSFINAGGFNANNGLLYLTAVSGSKTVSFGGSEAAEVKFAGNANWTISDSNATTSKSFTVVNGAVTLPSGQLTVGGDFIVSDTLTHNNGLLKLTNNVGTTTLTLSGNDLGSLRIVGTATTSMTDASAALSGDLVVEAGELRLATNTVSIAGSLDATGGLLTTASGTILFNSSDTGEFVNSGDNEFYNVVFASAGGGWTLYSATTTNNFSLISANNFTLSSGETLVVNGVFLNTVGGAATSWSNSNLVLDGQSAYTVNTKIAGGDNYESLIIATSSDIRMWNSVATTTIVASSSSLYSQDHGGNDGALNIYGDLEIGITTEYWNYANDFDGTVLTGGSRRPVTVSLASGATTTVTGTGNLHVIGGVGATTTVQSQESDSYTFVVDAGTINMSYYALRNMDANGLQLSGSPTITSLSNGDYELSVDSGNLITLQKTTLDANPSLSILDTRFATSAPATTGVNVNLSATSTNSWTFRDEYGGLSGELFDVDGVTDCGSIRWDSSSCLLTEQTEYRWRHDDGGIDVPDSEWLDTDWGKRKRVRVLNNDNTVYNNAAVMVNVAYDADMQSDFDDLRFTAADGVTEIDFWIERYDASVSADVWLEVSSLPADETVSLFMYYSNGTADSVSSSTATFVAVDDFEDNNITEYSGDTGLMQAGASFAYGGSYGLDLGVNQGTRLTNGIARFDQTASTGQTIRYQQYVDTGVGFSDESCMLFGVQSPVTGHQNYGVCLELFGVDRMTLAKNIESTDSYGGVVKLATTTVSYSTGWYEVEVDWQLDNTIDVYLYNPSGTLVATTSASDSTYSSGGYGFTSWGQNGGWDSFTVRPLMTSEPTTFFGVEQVNGGATYASAQSTPTSAFIVGDVARLRIAVENTGLDITGQEFRIEYAAKGLAPSCAAVSGGSYSEVPDNASCGASPVCMSTSTAVANGVVTTDLLEIDQNTFSPGSFVEDPSNKTSLTNVDQNHYIELEYALSATINASDQSYCFRLTDNGFAYDSYVNVPEMTLKFDPVIGSITFNNGQDISLTPGTTSAVYATGTVTDLNGYSDLVIGSSTMYRSGVSGGAACTSDNNDCYISTTANSCQYTNCSGNSCVIECYSDIYFHADPTDTDSPFEGEEWLAFIEVEDSTGGYDFSSAIGVELNTLRAIDTVGAINYGSLEVNSDTGSVNASTTILNEGNVEVDIEVYGTDLSDGVSSFIPADEQKYATSTFTYSSCGVACDSLSSTTPSQLDVDLLKPTTDNPPVEDDIFWGVNIPFGVSSVVHQGINVFTPISP